MTSISSIVLIILALLVIIIFVGSIYAFFYAIINFIFSSGDAEKIKKAWNSIRYMILGIIMTLGILFVFPILLKKANVPGYQYYTANNIFTQVSKITGGLVNFTKEAADNYQTGNHTNAGIIAPPSDTTLIEDNKSSTPPPSDDYDYGDLEL